MALRCLSKKTRDIAKEAAAAIIAAKNVLNCNAIRAIKTPKNKLRRMSV